ncbi:MAG: OmpA family protein [Kiritimatiellae bacterium]|nr:OmpA family protein [Kiritimatiellia bacterium]
MVVFSVALAFAVTGCKYGKANAGGKGGSGYGNANGQDVATIDDGTGDVAVEEGSLDEVGVRPFEEYCTRCTDVDFKPVYFGFDSTVVPQGEIGKIDEVAQHLAEKTDRVVVVEGNCDERGSNEYNMSLGENRAGIIRNYLVQSGVDASRIQTRSFGEEKPAAEGSDESAWALNRRGEFVIYQK